MYATTVCIVPPNTTCTTITKVETRFLIHFTAVMCSTILVHPLLSPI